MDHACFICLDMNQTAAKEACDDPPRNTCELHPLCWADDADKSCMNLALPDSSYCEIHSKKNCRGITKSGRACKGRAISLRNPCCSAHANQNPQRNVDTSMGDNFTINSTAEKSASDFVRCKAKNAKGKPCGTPSLPEKSYCSTHLERSSTISGKTIWEPCSMSEIVPNVEAVSTQPISSDVNDVGDTNADATQDISASQWSRRAKAAREAIIESIHDSSSEHGDCESFDVESSSSGSSRDFDVDRVNIGDEEEFEESEESEHLQHLREVDEVQNGEQRDSNGSDGDLKGEDDGDLEAISLNNSDFASEFVPVTEWNWDMSVCTRWSCVRALLEKWAPTCQSIFQLFRIRVANLKKELRLEKIKAKVKAYEGKSVIGGTIIVFPV